MGGPTARTVSAITSLGTSEFFQEKPFQGMTKEDRPTAGGGSPLRFAPGTTGVLPLLHGVTGSTASDPETGPGSPESQQKRMLREADAARTRAEQQLAARTETPQEALEARRRAGASADRLGGGRRRATDTLTAPGAALGSSY